MGKSLGNVLDPDLLLTKYGNDPVRWYLIKDISLGNDGDFQDKRFVDIINNDLANTIGNLLNRTSSMSRKWFDNKVPNKCLQLLNRWERRLIDLADYLPFLDSGHKKR